MASEGLHPEVRWVAGPAAGALYDLRDGAVHGVPSVFAGLLREHAATGASLSGLAVTAAERAFVETLRVGGLTVDSGVASPVATPPADLRPKLIWLEMTGRCNYTCQHCYADSDPAPRETLPTSRWQALIDEAAALGFPAIQFTGGDPFMHRDLLDLVSRAASRGFDLIEIYTNGSTLTPRVLDRLRELGVQLAVSFYSDRPEVYEAITRSQGFARVVDGIRGAVARGIPIRVGLIEMDENRDHVGRTVEFLAGLGVERARIHVDGVRPSGRGAALQPTACGGGGNLVPLERLDRQVAPPPIWRRPMSLPRTFRRRDGGIAWNTCWNGELVVAPLGEVYPCIFSRGVPLGNVAATSLAAVVAGDALQSAWRTTLADAADCEICEFRFACFDCRALTVNVTGDVRAKPPSCIYDPRTGRRDWARWLAQAGTDGARIARPRRLDDAALIVDETETGVLLRAAGGDWVGELSYLAAVVLEAADGELSVAEMARNFAASTSADPGEEAVLAACWELEECGLIAPLG